MARIDNLNNFLTDIADAIRTKSGSSGLISAEDFDTEIENIPTGGGDPTDYFNGNFKDSSKNAQAFFKGEYLKSTAELVPIDCTGKTSLSYLFSECQWVKLPKIINTSSVTDMTYLFSGCINATSIDLSAIDTTNVKKFGGLFSNCRSVTSLDLSKINTSALHGNSGEQFYSVFSNCQSLTSIDISTWELPSSGTTSRMPSMNSLFNGCYELQSLTPPANAFKVAQNLSNLFSGCHKLPASHIKGFLNKINNLKEAATYVEHLFDGCNLLDEMTLDISQDNTSSYQGCMGIFSNCYSLRDVDFTLNGYTSFQAAFQYSFGSDYVRGSGHPETVNVSLKAASGTFRGSMYQMFHGTCEYDNQHGSSGITDMTLNIDFNNCTYDLTSYSTLFDYCGAKVINFKNFTVTNTITSVCNMFRNGYMEEIHLINVNLTGTTNFANFFSQSFGNYKVIDLSGLTVSSSPVNLNSAFYGNNKLELLDIRCFTVSTATNTSSIIQSVPTSCVIVVKDDTEKSWFNTNYPTYTNVKTVAEYEAEQNA